MKNFVLLLLVVATAYAAESEEEAATTEEEAPSKVTEHWFEQPLDHFNLFDNRTWKQRYFVNREFFQPGKPLFLYIGGEAPLDPTDLTDHGQLTMLAKKHQGMIVNPEHRYYGESLPFGTDFKIENLKYLQIEQALEDLAAFIDYFKQSTPGLENSVVVVHGCSYPGMLATWVRLRFPNLVDIAYASSAPLGVGLDYPEFYQIVHDAYANVSQACIQTIKKGFNQTHELVKTKLGLKVVRDALRGWSCGDIDKMNSVKIIGKMESILDTMQDTAKYEELGCSVISGSDISAFHKLANFLVPKSHDQPFCEDTEDPTGISERTNIAWGYQTCTEMGTFQTLDIKDARNPFARDSSLQESVDNCISDLGGVGFEDILNKGIERVTRRYGGTRPKVTKVVTAQGMSDPWKHLSSLEDYNSEAPVFILRGAHCIDIKVAEDDPIELVEARKKIRDLVSKWIEEVEE